jgi:hypothetical protein
MFLSYGTVQKIPLEALMQLRLGRFNNDTCIPILLDRISFLLIVVIVQDISLPFRVIPLVREVGR